MNKKRIRSLSEFFYSELVDNTTRFWIEHATDREYGGFTTCLDRKGEMLSPDKPMWVMNRISWLFARLYNDLEPREEWLELARHGIEFIRKHGFDRDGRMFYAVRQDGKPLRKRRYLFTETFGIIALAEYARASGDGDCLSPAKKTMDLVLDLYGKPGALEPKVFPDTLKTRGHSTAMIQINTLQVLRGADPGGSYDLRIDDAIEEVFRYFVKPEKKVLLETVGENGEYLGHLPEGRCVIPGHAIETAWFIMEEGRHRNDTELVKRALPILDWSLEHFPDKEYGEWIGYLHRDGTVALDLKGYYFKGPFHLPRQQLFCHLLLEEMLANA